MARHNPVIVGLALVLVIVIHIVQADDKCRSGCGTGTNNAKYEEGTTYKYDYNGKISISLSSAEGQQSTTEVRATVLLTQQSKCNQILRLQNVQVFGSDGKQHSNIPDIDKQLGLNFFDGHTEDVICAEPGDTQNSINIKRAIASIFQANLKETYETDVFGLCPTEISSTQESSNTIVIHKSKNLNKCAYRESISHNYLSTIFDLNSEVKTSPVLNGDYTNKMKIVNGVLEHAEIVENYLFVPFSIGKDGAKAVVETKLKLTGTSKDNVAPKVSVPKSIIFENPHPINAPKNSVNDVLKAVKQTAKTINIIVNENTAKEYINLIRLLRISNKADILTVYNQVRAGVGFDDKLAAKKVFLDALLAAGNGDTIEVAIELLKSKELTPIEEKKFYLGLSFARHITEPSLITAVDLLNRPHLPREAYLGIGTVVGRYCKEHCCANSDAVNKITLKLISKLGDLKAANRLEENEMIYALKALRNIHHLTDAVLLKLTKVAEDTKQPNRLRVAALEAYLADPSKEKLKESATKILKDIQQDSEIRIKAYLILVEAPTAKTATIIRSLLEKEPSYQLGGFIVSHIRNLRSSANSEKDHAKEYLRNIHLPTRFPIDLRKYSFNAEISYAVDSLGLANNVESNVIYSQDSWLPRSTTLNLTSEIFGHRINFLEVATRQENLDRLVEHYLGPKGELRKMAEQGSWGSLTKPVVNVYETFKNKVEKSLRARRDVSKAEIEGIGKQVEIKTNALNTDLDLDLDVKVFGNEVLFLSATDDIHKWSPTAFLDNMVKQFNHGLDSLKSFEETFRSNLLFLDAELTYPTSLGFPLRLAVEGSSNIQLKASGSVDLRALLVQNKDTALHLKLIPSGTLQVQGRLTLDALVVESGLKVGSSLHSSTGGEINVEIFNSGKGLDVKLGLPVQKQHLIAANHEIVFLVREHGIPEVSTPLKFAQNKDFSICLDQLKDFIGLEFCADVYGPNQSGKEVPILPFPLSGDAQTSITVENLDIANFHFRDIVFVGDKIGGEILVESVGKGNHKKVVVEIQTQVRPEMFVKVGLKTPIKNADLEGRINNNEHEKSLSIKVKDDNDEYFGRAGISVQGGGAKSIYKPILEYRIPGQSAAQAPAYHVDGQVVVERNGPNVKYTLDNVKLVIPGQRSVAVKGNFGTEGSDLFTDLTVTDGQLSGSLKGKIQAKIDLLKFNAEVTNSLNPLMNFNVKAEYDASRDQVKGEFQLVHGKDLNSKVNVINIMTSANYKLVRSQLEFLSTKNKFTYPLLKIDTKFDLETTPSSLEYILLLQYSELKLGSDLAFKMTPTGDYHLDFKLNGLNNKLELKANRIQGKEESKIDHALDINGKKFEITGKIKHHIKAQDIDIGQDLIVKLPTHNEPFKIDSGLVYTPSILDFHYKVLAGATPLIEAVLKGTKGGNVNGHVKVTFKEILIINGQIKAIQGKGIADLLIDVKGFKRSVKAESSFTIQDPIYNVDVTFYPLFNENKSKKITLSTKSKITPGTVESKNSLDLLGNKFELDVNGKDQGDFFNGKHSCSVELTLPNQNYFLAKVDKDRKVANGMLNGNLLASLEQRKNKNSVGRKVTWKSVAVNTNVADGIFDLEYILTGDDGQGHTLNADLTLKRKKNGDKYDVALKNKIYGSVLKHPIELGLIGECKEFGGSYHVTGSISPEAALDIKGSHTFVEIGKPILGDLNVDVKTPFKLLKSVKFHNAGKLTIPEGTNGKLLVNVQTKLKLDGADPTPLIDFTGALDVIGTEDKGHVKISSDYGKHGSIAVAADYDLGNKKTSGKVHGDIAVRYGNNKNIKGDLTIVRLGAREYKAEAILNLPTDKYKSNKLVIHTKTSEDAKQLNSDVQFSSDNEKWSANSDLNLSDLTPSINVKMVNPEKKLSQIAAKVNRLSATEFGAEIRIENQKKNFLFEGSIDINADNVNDFYFKLTANSPTLKLDKVYVEAHNKPDGGGRKIQVDAKSGSKNLLTGSAAYTTREEQGKLIVEGSGTFKVKEQSQSANFKYIRQNLVIEKNGEKGVQISFDAALGNKAIDAELKITNKHFRYLNSYCEEKKQCANIEIDARTVANDVAHFNQIIEISIDLRKLGLTHEFGMKAVTDRKGYHLLEHTVDVHFQSAQDSKYQYSVYVNDKKAGLSLTTPKRIVSLEAHADIPTKPWTGGKYSSEIVFYTDKKNKPSVKSALTATGHVDITKRIFEAEAKFTPAKQGRSLSIKTHWSEPKGKLQSSLATIELDIFAQPNQKIIVTLKSNADYTPKKQQTLGNIDGESSIEIKSAGLAIDVNLISKVQIVPSAWQLKYDYTARCHLGQVKSDSTAKLSITREELILLLKVHNIELIFVTSKLQLKKGLQTVNTDIRGRGIKPTHALLEIKNYNVLKYTVARKDHPNDPLIVTAALIPGQIADLRAEVVKAGTKHDLFHASVKLDEANFLRPDYGLSAKNIKEYVLNVAQADIVSHTKELRNIGNRLVKEATNDWKKLGELAKKATPNFKQVKDFYAVELKSFKDELLQDKSIKELSEFLNNVFGAIIKTVSETIVHFSELVETIAKILTQSFAHSLEVIEKELVPVVNDILAKIGHALANVVDEISEIVLTVLAEISKLIETYQPQLKLISTAFGELFQEISRFAVSIFAHVNQVFKEQLEKLKQEIKALPILKELKDQLEQLKKELLPTTETIVRTLRSISETLKEIVVVPEIQNLISQIESYLEKKVTHKPVDDFEELEEMVRLTGLILNKLSAVVYKDRIPESWENYKFPLSFDYISRLPRLVAVKFSPLTYLIKEEGAGLSDLVLSLFTTPRKLIPPIPLDAVVAQGQHIFTFDGKHITFPGQCSYLWSRDGVNGNFSIVGTYENGLLSGVTLFDKTGLITIKKGGIVLLNSVVKDFPVRSGDLIAIRSYSSITIKSNVGVKVKCDPDLTVCGIEISGFYHGQLKGLLGNANNEPFDDFTLPNGKIVTTESEFGNAYKIGSSCPQVKTVDHSAHHANPACATLFNWDSPLRYCYPFVSKDNFKMACEHGLAAGVKDTEKAIALAYAYLCNVQGVPVRVPSAHNQCTNGDKPYNVGDIFSVKVPAQSADIVLMVETVKNNEHVYTDLVKPIVKKITKDLSEKGISDVLFHVIAYGGENKHPVHVTLGGKLAYKGEVPDLKFVEKPVEKKITTGCWKLDRTIESLRWLLDDLKLGLGLNARSEAYKSAINYPFRAGAAKTVIAVVTEPCKVGVFFPLQVANALLYWQKEVHLNLITPITDLTAIDEKQPRDIVGFNLEKVFTYTHRNELHKHLNYNDFCIDYTIQSGGNVFTTRNIHDTVDGKNGFIHFASTNIVNQIKTQEQGLDCECKIINTNVAQNVCKVVQTKEK